MGAARRRAQARRLGAPMRGQRACGTSAPRAAVTALLSRGGGVCQQLCMVDVRTGAAPPSSPLFLRRGVTAVGAGMAAVPTCLRVPHVPAGMQVWAGHVAVWLRSGGRRGWRAAAAAAHSPRGRRRRAEALRDNVGRLDASPAHSCNIQKSRHCSRAQLKSPRQPRLALAGGQTRGRVQQRRMWSLCSGLSAVLQLGMEHPRPALKGVSETAAIFASAVQLCT